MNPLRLLFWCACGVPLLALWPATQDPAATDWAKEVERACTAQRYGLRLAAAKKVGTAGAAAVPALRAYAERHGRNAIQPAIVDAMADHSGTEPAVLDLLREWTADRDFYWRASALRGLARRAPALPAQRDELRELFAEHHGDPAWLARTFGRLGSALLGDGDVLAQPETDPRATVKLTAQLLQLGQVPPLQPLLDALAEERTFQGVPWGQGLAREAHAALKAWLGPDHPAGEGEAFADKPTALEKLRAAAAKKSGQELTVPAIRRDPDLAFVGGVEVLSCKHGDVFLQWTAAGEVHAGLTASRAVSLPATAWTTLQQDAAQLAMAESIGEVVCDSLRLRLAAPALHSKVAPHSLPPATLRWLQTLASGIEQGGDPALAEKLRGALGQFAHR